MPMEEFHWALELLQNIDVGMVVLDRQYRIQAWNSFVENHSTLPLKGCQNKLVFEVFQDLPEDWFRNKVDAVFLLDNRAFTIWEQRPYVFRFKNYRPITGTVDYMYQNLSLIPLRALNGQVGHVGIVIYDVTDIAVNKQALRAANHRLECLSQTDGLTGLFNRCHWEACLVAECQRYRRTQQVLSLVMFDIDHFKRVNDTHGHQSGDQVIRTTADLLRKLMRQTDIGGRYGGEEFGVLLVATPAQAAMVFAERLRSTIEAHVVEGEPPIRYTISLGGAELSPQTTHPEALIARADAALYRAKQNGRNRVERAE